MKKYIVGLVLFSMVSCNPVGEDVAEIALLPNQITSLKGIDLKKGDEIVFWSKVATSESTDYKIKYSIALNNKIISYDSTSVMSGERTINSKVSNDAGFISGLFGERNETIEFERENKSFKATEDGKYDFDFKLYNPEDDSFFRQSFSLKLRIK